jgi:UDP-MurNAc hydroxylase
VTYLGQACTLVEAAGRKIVTDPWLTEGAYFGTWFHTHLLADAGVSPATIPADVDYVFLSHEHQDHVDPDTLRTLRPDVTVLICKFPSDRFKRFLQGIGLTNIRECVSGQEMDLGDGLKVTIIGTAEYTNDSAIVIEADGVRVFNETDCKPSFHDLEREAAKGIDLGFYMFSGANWFPILYDYDEATMADQIQRRRATLLKSFVKRVRSTKPKMVVPGAGPCTVLDPERLYLNTAERGIFVDPLLATSAVEQAELPSKPLYMAVSDVWDSRTGFEPHAPAHLRRPRMDYLRDASARMAGEIASKRRAETAAGSDLGSKFAAYFGERVAAQSEAMRRKIAAKVAFHVTGPQGGDFTIDFTASDRNYVREGIAPDWTYRIEAEDKLVYPFVSGKLEFLEDLFLSLRVRLARRPDQYNELLYHWLYDPDPERLHDRYEKH